MNSISDSDPVKRKVQLAGGSTFTLSIPKEWATQRDISPGTGLLIYPFDDRLVVAPAERNDGGRTTVIDADSLDEELLAWRMRAAYVSGADAIEVRSKTGLSTAQRRLASSIVTDLVGMEIAEESETELRIRSLLNAAEVSLERTIEQLRNLALPMHRDAIEAVRTDDAEFAAQVAARDDDVDRLFALVSRQFHRVLTDVREMEHLEPGHLRAFAQFRIARQLERVADHAERIAAVTDRQPAGPPTEVADRLAGFGADARRVVTTALDGDAARALGQRADVLDAADTFDRELHDSRTESTYLYGRIVERVRRTAEHGGNVAEVVALLDATDNR
ncbi:phosphate signaling complex PhoU family protein [Natronomonas halophila]|uniref:phosphate signaling complex PhoU family protein n=1 Tax=Natronomonas halophila TaxID=2747817 RepID=UPI001FECBCAC|nr:phosphate uptake regulator PhoU [Natronomonas halophila]